MQNLLISIPHQHDLENPALELSPKRLEQQHEKLPTHDIFATVGELDAGISQLNVLHLPDADRLKLLEVYNTSFDNIMQVYDEMRLKQLKITDIQRKQLTKSIMWLYVKLAHGYKIIVKHGFDAGENPKRSDTLALSIFRSIELTFSSVLYARRGTIPLPPATYIEAAQLYALAEESDIAGKRIRAAKGYADTPTIEGIYKLLLLLAVFEPDSFNSISLAPLFLGLQPFVKHAVIFKSPPKQSDACVYRFSLNSNKTPDLYHPEDALEKNTWLRYFDISNMLVEIMSWSEKNQGQCDSFFLEEEVALFNSFLQYMEQQPATRHHNSPSVKANKEIESRQLLLGLANIQNLLIAQAISKHIPISHPFSHWQEKSSDHGSCVLLAKLTDIKQGVELGEIVALADQNDGLKLQQLAIVETASFVDQFVELQLRKLSETAYPVTYVPVCDKTQMGDHYNGICFSKPSQQTGMLLIEKKHYNQSQRYSLDNSSQACIIKSKGLAHEFIRYVVIEYEKEQEGE